MRMFAISALSALSAAYAGAHPLPQIYPTVHRQVCDDAVAVDGAALDRASFERKSGTRGGWYRIVAGAAGVRVEAADDDGEFYARRTLAQLRTAGRLPGFEIEDWPDIPRRGIVEGFYGRTWSHEGRKSLLRFCGDMKLNTFIYGPKDDPYHHSRWREDYPAPMAAQFRELLALARENRVHLVWAIHLGTDFGDAKIDDARRERILEAVFAKLDKMYAIGFRAFGVFFDDYGGSAGELHAWVCNRIQHGFADRKGDCEPVVMCPNAYWGDGSGEYCRTIGEKLDPRIDIMWTGRGICTPIESGPLASVTGHYRRAPYVWWNWPVNDYCRRSLMMGRTYGLADGEYRGFVSNPMEQSEASKVALFGVADWSWNRAGFDSERSWRDSIARIFPYAPAAMMKFCEHVSDQGVNGHGFRRVESEAFAPVAAAFAAGQAEARARVESEFAAIAAAAAELERKLPAANPELWREISYWVQAFARQGAMGLAALKAADRRLEPAARKAAYREYVEHFREREKLWDRHLAEQQADNKVPGAGCNWRECRTGWLVVEPLINRILDGEWKSLGLGERYRAFSTVAQIAHPLAERRDDARVYFGTILERVTVGPGEHFGFTLPEGMHASWFHAEFDDAAAAKGVIELTQDGGKTWKAVEMRVNGATVQRPLDANAGWNGCRYVNRTGAALTFKIKFFRMDVQ